MQTFLYLIIFTLGCFCGSFFTLAVYRIPKNEDILIKHSYCPNCEHKLGLLDLFPVLSYVFLGGKCRYCKDKIRPRYLILEIFSGIVFLIIAVSLKLDIYNITFSNVILLIMTYLFVSVLIIIAGIDKEYIKVEKKVLIVGFIIEIIYIIYQCTLSNVDVYKYVIYLIFMIILLILSLINLKQSMKVKYYVQILFLSLYIIIFTGGIIYVLTSILTLLSIALYKLNKKNKKNIPIAFLLSIWNIVVLIITNIICNWII